MDDDVFGSASEGDVSSPQDTSSQDTSNLQEDVEEDTTQLNVEIPTELHRQLKARSALTGTSMKRLVAEILDRNLDTDGT